MAIKKASFNLSDEDLQTLRELAEERDISLTYALRQAISDSAFLQREILDSSGKASIQQPNGTIQKITVLR